MEGRRHVCLRGTDRGWEAAKRKRAPWLPALPATLATAVVVVIWLAVPSTYPSSADDIVIAGFNVLAAQATAVFIATTLPQIVVVALVLGVAGEWKSLAPVPTTRTKV